VEALVKLIILSIWTPREVSFLTIYFFLLISKKDIRIRVGFAWFGFQLFMAIEALPERTAGFGGHLFF